MIPFPMVVIDEFSHGAAEVELPSGIIRPRHSSLIDRTKRSAYALAFGAWSGVCTTWRPASSNSRRTSQLHFRSRSQISTRWPRRSPTSPAVSVRPTSSWRDRWGAASSRGSAQGGRRGRSQTPCSSSLSAPPLPHLCREEIGAGDHRRNVCHEVGSRRSSQPVSTNNRIRREGSSTSGSLYYEHGFDLQKDVG